MRELSGKLMSSTDRQGPGKTEDLIIVDLGVGGSSPPGGTNKINELTDLRLLCGLYRLRIGTVAIR